MWTRWHEGDVVCALVSGGGYAEYCVAPDVQCLPIPSTVDLVSAAAMPETFFTVWTNVFERGRLRAGESFLVHGGASGIGTTAIQMARAFGARVFATAGTDEKCVACERLGAERAINYKTEDFVAAVTSLTGGTGVDVILDMVGAPYFSRNVDLLALEGRLLQIAVHARREGRNQSRAPAAAAPHHYRIDVAFPNGGREGAIAGAIEKAVWPLVEAGKIRPIVFATFPLRQAAEAHRLMESGSHIGKIVLTV